VMNGDGQDLLGHRLPDDVGVEVLDDLAGSGDFAEQLLRPAAAALLLVENRLAQLDALSADVNVARPFHQGADLAITFAAERTIRVFLAGRAAIPGGEVFTRRHQRSL